MNKLLQLDIKIFRFINQRCHSVFLDIVMPWCTLLGSAGFSVIIFFLLTIVVPKVHGTTLFLSMFISQFLTHGIKHLGKRMRPHLALPDTLSDLRPSFFDPSFPSAHTAAVTSWCATTAFCIPQTMPYLAFIVLLVAFSRIYMGQHYPSDVIMGAIIGIVPAALIFLL